MVLNLAQEFIFMALCLINYKEKTLFTITSCIVDVFRSVIMQGFGLQTIAWSLSAQVEQKSAVMP
jgi:hypothetical protein